MAKWCKTDRSAPKPRGRVDLSKVTINSRIQPGYSDSSRKVLVVQACYEGRKIGGVVVEEFSYSGLPVGAVGFAAVADGFRGKGIGTMIYERAATESCTKLKAPLASDLHRSVEAQGFWKKQLSKGRASRVKIPKEHRKPGSRHDVFILSCPAPASLKGVK